MRESCGIKPMHEWVERRTREWDEYITRMDAERLVKMPRDNIPAGKKISRIFTRRLSDLIID
jgi:hypothetical protein